MARIGFAAPDEAILLVGAPDWLGHASRPVDLPARAVRPQGRPAAAGRPRARSARPATSSASLIRDGHATAVHDLSDGGLAVGLAEMAMASGIGATVNQLDGGDPIPQFFGEDQGRYLVTVQARVPRELLRPRSTPMPASSRRGSAPPAAPR